MPSHRPSAGSRTIAAFRHLPLETAEIVFEVIGDDMRERKKRSADASARAKAALRQTARADAARPTQPGRAQKKKPTAPKRSHHAAPTNGHTARRVQPPAPPRSHHAVPAASRRAGDRLTMDTDHQANQD